MNTNDAVAVLREALTNAMDECVLGQGSYGKNYDGNKLAKLIREALAATDSAATVAKEGGGWISVRDRLPEFDFASNRVSMVLRVIAALDDGSVCAMNYMSNGWTKEEAMPAWHFPDGRHCLAHHVTHWMPLPARPAPTAAPKPEASAATQQAGDADPMSMPLPCDIKVGICTHGKGTRLSSLVARMRFLHACVEKYGPKSYRYDEEHPNDGLNAAPISEDTARTARNAGVAAPDTSARKLTGDHPIIKFLTGEEAYEGVWFGEKHPERGDMFWWRSVLRDVLAKSKG